MKLSTKMILPRNITIKLDSLGPSPLGSSTISKKNFDRNLKNANDEIQRLRRELEEKNRIIYNLNSQELTMVRRNDGYHSSANHRDPIHQTRDVSS